MSDEPKSRSEIDKRLSEEERESLFALVERSTLLEGVSWLRVEHDIKLSPTALGKWAEKQRRKGKDVAFHQLLGDLRHDTKQASEIASAVGNAAQLNDANVVMLSQALFSARRTGDPAELKAAAKLFSMVLEANAKSKAAEASVIAAETSRDKFQYDAAKAALAHAAELQKISTSAGTEREKIERAIVAVFGRHPTQAGGVTILAGGNLESERVPSDHSDGEVVSQSSGLQEGRVGDSNFIARRPNSGSLEVIPPSNSVSKIDEGGNK